MPARRLPSRRALLLAGAAALIAGRPGSGWAAGGAAGGVRQARAGPAGGTGSGVEGAAKRGAPPPLRILCFGDSILAGPGLAAHDRFPAQLGRWLATAGAPALQMRVAAISGDTSYGGRARIGLALFRRCDAAIIAIGANDMLLGWSARRAEANLDAILTRARQDGRPVLLGGVAAMGGDAVFRAGWDAIWPRLAARHGCLLVPDLYAPIRAAGAGARGHLLQADGLHASAAGVAAMVAAAGPQALTLVRAAARHATG